MFEGHSLDARTIAIYSTREQRPGEQAARGAVEPWISQSVVYQSEWATQAQTVSLQIAQSHYRGIARLSRRGGPRARYDGGGIRAALAQLPGYLGTHRHPLARGCERYEREERRERADPEESHLVWEYPYRAAMLPRTVEIRKCVGDVQAPPVSRRTTPARGHTRGAGLARRLVYDP